MTQTLTAVETKVYSLSLAVATLTERINELEGDLETTQKVVDEMEERVEKMANFIKAKHPVKPKPKPQRENKGIYCGTCTKDRGGSNRVYHATKEEARRIHT